MVNSILDDQPWTRLWMLD